MKKDIIYTILTSMLLLSCQKCKSPLKPANDCKEIGSEPVQGFIYSINKSYSYPSFYKEGISYIKVVPYDSNSNQSYDIQLCYYNIQTQKNNIITHNLPNIPSGEIDNDWNVFTGQYNVIWKIKMNGDSLTQLTNQVGFFPAWNPVTKIISYTSSGQLNFITHLGINLPFNDTIYVTNGAAWSYGGYKLAFFGKSMKNGFSGLQIYDWSTQVSKLLIPNNSFINEGRISWAEDEKYLIFNADNNIYKIDCQTLTIDTIKKGCESINYLFPFLKNERVVYTKVEKERKGDTLNIKSGIYQLDMLTNKEEEIYLSD